MTFEKILETVRDKFSKTDVSKIEGKLAFQFNLTGEDGGVFYTEVKDGKLSIEPYEYNDRDAGFTISTENFIKLIDGKLDPIMAHTLGKLKVDGDIGKALQLPKLMGK